MMSYLAVDIETTGLKPGLHGIIQFAAVDSVTKKRFHRWFDPEGYVWSNYCLKLHINWIITMLDRMGRGELAAISDAKPKIIKISDLAVEFEDWLVAIGRAKADDAAPRFTALGKNFGPFDLQFLNYNGMGNFFRHRALDVAPYYTEEKDELPPDLRTCKMRAIQRGCNFNSVEVAHTALEDALDTMTLYEFYRNNPWLCYGKPPI